MLSSNARLHGIQFLLSLSRFCEKEAVRCSILYGFGACVRIRSLIHGLIIVMRKQGVASCEKATGKAARVAIAPGVCHEGFVGVLVHR